MCGIAGFVLRDGGRPDPAELMRMGAALAHRGPDDRGIHIAGPVGLAQTRLSIIGLATGHQPLVSEDGRLALVANGEVYNYLELNADLRAQGRRLLTESDSETILHAYAVLGLGFLNELRGMYAFALHDAGTGRLILGRDRLGIKPLFYVRLPDRIAFASEIKALLPILPQGPRVSPAALRQFLQNQFATGEDTIITGICRVLPGEALIIDAGLSVRRHRYWSALDVPPRDWGLDEAQAKLNRLMDQVMREHMRSDVPFGLFLSGGTDSAILAERLAALGAGPIKTFSVGYQGASRADELDEATRIAAHFGLDHRALRLTLPRVFGRIPHTIWSADELMRDYACLPTSILAETAGAELKVVFSGEGGTRSSPATDATARASPSVGSRPCAIPAAGASAPAGNGPPDGPGVCSDRPCRPLRWATGNPFSPLGGQTPPGWSDLKRRQYVDLVTALPDNLLVKTDRMLMAFSLEGRVPFLDHRLVEFGLSLPDDLKERGRQGKWLLKRWAGPRLPAGHLQRPKRGFHVPVGDWLTGDLAERVGERLAGNRGIRQWFRVPAIADLVRARQAGRGGSRELFGLLQFAIWHRLFIEQPGLKPSPDEDPLEWV